MQNKEQDLSSEFEGNGAETFGQGYSKKDVKPSSCDGRIAHLADKRVQSIEEHSFSVGDLAGNFMEKAGLGSVGYMAGSLHDLGKLSSLFQRYIASANGLISRGDIDYLNPSSYKGQIDHSTAGAKFCMDLPGNGQYEKLSKEMVALSIMAHHSGLPDVNRPGKDSSFENRLGLGEERTHYEEIKKKILPEKTLNIADFFKFRCVPEVEIYANKVNKSEKGAPFYFRLGLMTRFLMSCLVDADRLDTSSFTKGEPMKPPERPDWEKISETVDQYVSALGNDGAVGGIRRKVSEYCAAKGRGPKGTYTLSVPTGGGKTLSSLRFALQHAAHHSMDRIIYVAPFISIIDQNARAIRNAIGQINEEIVTEYHSSISRDEHHDDDSRVADDNWDSPIVLTTMVQYLNTFFAPGTTSARRMHNLANSVIIFDEVQSIPTRCIHAFNMSVNFLKEDCGTTSVLCTATQPGLDQMDRSIQLSESPEIVPPEVFVDMPARTKIVDRRSQNEWKFFEIAELALERYNKGESVLIILNTKKTAESVSREIEKSIGDVQYLSTNLCPNHRIRVIEMISRSLSEKVPIICVSTQIIEAGIDLDFDVVIRSLAGLDSIVQAAGRCNRNGRSSVPGEVLVINPIGENVGSLIEIRVGKQVAGRIMDDMSPNSPEAIPEYRRRYYAQLKKVKSNIFDYPIDEFESSMVKMLSDNNFEYRSKKFLLNQSFRSVNTSFKAIDDSSIGLIILQAGGKKDVKSIMLAAENTGVHPYKEVRSAQKFMVNVRNRELEKMKAAGTVKQIPGTEVWVYSGNYDSKYGLIMED
ncbi:MAG: CRISPR-associated helicase Cas3' [Candidatus Methanomethylophilaceae archaeon]|nr:CRISPR-associated helicase Cas3' [Candidatus Methanomethylophilaceae archaeon]